MDLLPTTLQTKDIFLTDEITFFGLDFSSCRLIGTHGFTNPADICNRYFKAWNSLFYKEQVKFNLHSFFIKKSVRYNSIIVESRNKVDDPYSIRIMDNYEIPSEKIEEIIGEYNTTGLEAGIGVVFIVESLNSIIKKGIFHLVYFDIANRKALLDIKLSGKPFGLGIRNFWMGAVYDVLKQIRSNTPRWKSKYCSK